MSMRDRILTKLTEAFRPISVEVIDESDQHRGHAGVHQGRGETHFRIRITAPRFAGKSRVEQHRLINLALSDELAAGVHALAIEARSA
ncbi:MAG: BolA family transcriptional regulator [Ancalomicrobiaceae bacterium]|nr:BolA family transcriptional regulator [Ancalomicrobiaceae bacterium]